MHITAAICSALSMSSVATALSVALPLYEWPLPGAWDPVYNTIASNPSTTFDIIVNPNSGPGNWPLSSDYRSGVAKLNSYPNVNIYGYLKVGYTSRAISKVVSEISTYAKWSSYRDGSLQLAGIFVDEAPYSLADVPYMAKVGQQIRNIMPQGSSRVWTNPGCVVADEYYNHADVVTAFEDTYDYWKSPQRRGIPDRRHGASSVMILDYSGSRNGVKAEAQTLINRRFHSAFVRGFEGYQDFSQTWKNFAVAVNNAQA